jgi:hypothetical protein
MTNKDAASVSPDTITVMLEDGTEAQRPYGLRRASASADTDVHARVPIAYPGEEAVPTVDGWLIRRIRK